MDFESLGQLGSRADETLTLLAHQHGDGAKLVQCKRISAQTCERLIRRIKAMTTRLLPIQVDRDDITAPTSDIITPDVVTAYSLCAGDFSDALPYCLLEARRSFHKDALANPADYDENLGRKLACEAIARKLIAKAPIERQPHLLCGRFVHLESDGDETLASSALETATDQDATHFLSSGEAQRVTTALWRGRLIQEYDEDGHISYVIYREAGKGGFLAHLNPSRLAVPAYQNCLRIALWVLFLIAYAAAVQTPERGFGTEDVILYVQLAGYVFEDLVKVYKTPSLQALSFWQFVNFGIWTLLLVALGFRVADWTTPAEDLSNRRTSFMILSCAAPLIWAKILTVFDLVTFFGVMQIVVARMLRESAVFFALLAFLAIGFTQSLTGLDVADASRDSTINVVRTLVESVLGSPNFDLYADGPLTYPYGLVLYYIFSFLTLVILLNVLVALFSSAYAQVTDDAIAHYLAFFSRKVVSAIRAPDEFVFVAPFNLVEFLIIPLELVLSRESYAQLNRRVMTVLFFPALCCIALYESLYDTREVRRQQEALEDAEDDSEDQDPEAHTSDEGTLSKVSFDDLIKRFPDLNASVAAVTLKEVRALRSELQKLSAVKREE